MSDRESTPSYRGSRFSFSTSYKARVDAADPNNALCLITNDNVCIQYCHCIPRRLSEDGELLDKLEWAWNMKRFSLNLDSRLNVFIADIRFHTMFDQRRWLLLPEDDIIKSYYESLKNFIGVPVADRKSFPEFHDRKTFFYKFVPLKNDLGLISRRIGFDPTTRSKAESIHHDYPFNTPTRSKAEFIHHDYPFNTLPLLESHLHPKFVIYDAGIKMFSFLRDPSFTAQMVRDFPSLKMTVELYIAWALNPLPDSSVNDPTYYDPDADEDEDSDKDGNDDDDPKDGDYVYHTTRTRHRRLGDIWPCSRTRNAAKQDGNDAPEDGVQEYPLPSTKQKAQAVGPIKRKVLSGSSSHNQPLLSEVTLSRHTQQLGEVSGTDRVHEWKKVLLKKKRKLR